LVYSSLLYQLKRLPHRNSVQCQKLQQLFEAQSFGLDTAPQSFCYSLIAPSIIHCSKSAQKFKSSRYCCYGNHARSDAAGSTPVLKLCITSIQN